jgi:orotidine-5'-phosphate decarboxylase
MFRISFFEYFGKEGWDGMNFLISYLKRKGVFVIADAKRADIGNSSNMYAKSFYDEMESDALTLSPYMGYDSLKPFFEYENKTSILLALTSNEGSNDFQMLKLENGKKLYEQVIETSLNWETKGNIMYVIGATRADELENIRRICPDNFLLIPGVGHQGGSLEEVIEKGRNKNIGLLINVSRSIIYADNPSDEAHKIQKIMEKYV